MSKNILELFLRVDAIKKIEILFTTKQEPYPNCCKLNINKKSTTAKRGRDPKFLPNQSMDKKLEYKLN